MALHEVDPQILLLYRVFDVTGVLLMGIIGGTIARQRGFDIVGFLFIALFSSLGGGMIRDVLINRGTVAAMSESEYLMLAFAGALIARFVYFKGSAWERFQVHADATVSGLWAATGCVKALSFGLPVLACVMMGVFTAVGGGMIRDVVTGRIPSIFGDNVPAVIPAIACTAIVISADVAGFLAVGMVIGPIVSVVITVWGYWTGWRPRADSEWAPVNVAAAVMERKGRRVGRRLEPTRIRAWRHRQMEKALQRRLAMAQHVDTPTAQEALEALSQEFELPSAEETSGIGMDFGGDSYDNYDADTGRESNEFVQAAQRAGIEVEHQEGALDSKRMTQELMDMVLQDDKLMDELLERLAEKYQRGQET
ncbi:trimeric intracellular cation channel family protein [Corynebacterium tapiri]|uniref:Trimeric intracellular cation channel family protein n=1 Tax=Corynebacterium tapiri TaxID=1448266 RepID=A0A5C4U4X3_9CORY|nr:trimeric intracellular cation channel family protein [Corynebacterium tapiri]TNL98757.1 trimeric intracellular cation channel family protein [Corynebacterium tapiri]